MGRRRRNRRGNPRFPINLWNMRDRVNDSLPRTDNSVEASVISTDSRLSSSVCLQAG